ncbi:hypothetical protein RJ641_003760 [Dillenia turbinata]|uniref:F-box domain-containing protein n=1 Tax=Dillenia turbinata TaxID=194707 RepID=A0AAN8VH45_9MAGN
MAETENQNEMRNQKGRKRKKREEEKVGMNENKKRKSEAENEGEEEEEKKRQDPLVVFGTDIMTKILGYLDARSVALSLLVSRGWHGVASSDKLWTSKNLRFYRSKKAISLKVKVDEMGKFLLSGVVYLKKGAVLKDMDELDEVETIAALVEKKEKKDCKELWNGKAHIPRVSQARGLSMLAAYAVSLKDGKRNRIMKEDLCDHAWEFHFNKAAPEYWRNLDPYWKGIRPLMHRYFHPDGSQTADPGDKVWGGHECCYSIVTSFIGEGKIREHYVRINRWPQMSISRKSDWSWEMSNHLYSYSSIPNADKEGGTGPYTVSLANFVQGCIY